MSNTESSVPYGYCHCGCGERTAIAWRNYHDRGIRKGEPLRFVHLHHTRVRDPEAEFWKRVKKTDLCWLWTGPKNDNGYGLFNVDGRQVRAHRWIYQRLVAPVADGLHLDHLCRIRHCVNPDHLDPVTPVENLHRGLDWSGNRTHCPHGHPYSSENTSFRPDGSRLCRTCRNARERRRYARRRAEGYRK